MKTKTINSLNSKLFLCYFSNIFKPTKTSTKIRLHISDINKPHSTIDT